MSTPRTKRPFAGAAADPSQRQITSYLTTVPDAGRPMLRQPLLPSTVQANLLSVGMRVRKSVPEGYKTIGHSAFKLWTDNTPISNGAPTATMRASSRELLPFCGINKVGGLDSQAPFVDDLPDLDAVPELTMSQESVESNPGEPSRKRYYSDDEEDDRPTVWVPNSNWDDTPVSPRSSAPMQGNARVMAVPKSRIRKSVSFHEVGQENMAVDDDFEEADFLVFGEAREMDTS